MRAITTIAKRFNSNMVCINISHFSTTDVDFSEYRNNSKLREIKSSFYTCIFYFI